MPLALSSQEESGRAREPFLSRFASLRFSSLLFPASLLASVARRQHGRGPEAAGEAARAGTKREKKEKMFLSRWGCNGFSFSRLLEPFLSSAASSSSLCRFFLLSIGTITLSLPSMTEKKRKKKQQTGGHPRLHQALLVPVIECCRRERRRRRLGRRRRGSLGGALLRPRPRRGDDADCLGGHERFRGARLRRGT